MEEAMNNFMRVAVLSALLGVGSAWAEGLAKADQKLLTDLAMANMAEIETAKLALQKTQSDRIKSFAQQMVDDHTKGLEEVRKVAAMRNVSLPSELDAKHKAMAAKLEKLTGDKFDRSYMEQAGVKAHREAHKLVSKGETSAQDSEVKALVTRLQPTIHQHLNNAEQLNAAIKGGTTVGSSGTEGASGSGKPERR
jgi:putative membrane protein